MEIKSNKYYFQVSGVVGFGLDCRAINKIFMSLDNAVFYFNSLIEGYNYDCNLEIRELYNNTETLIAKFKF